jgi:hypothetical protein
VPVLVEGLSVIVRLETIETRLAGGLEQFRRLAPAATLCTDGELVRVGFETNEGMTVFLRVLVALGLRYAVGPAEDDVASCRVAIDADGPRAMHSPCDWVGYANYIWTETGAQVVTASLRKGHAPQNSIALPPGWEYETSQSAVFRVK